MRRRLESAGRLSTFVASALLGAYYLGLWLWAAGLLCILGLVIASAKPTSTWMRLPRLGDKATALLLCLYPLIAFAVQLAKLRMGIQGVDFAIFSQVTHSFSERWELTTSLVDVRWQHFLTHHFSPYLYISGIINMAVGDAEITLLALHSVAIAGILYTIFLVAQHFELLAKLSSTAKVDLWPAAALREVKKSPQRIPEDTPAVFFDPASLPRLKSRLSRDEANFASSSFDKNTSAALLLVSLAILHPAPRAALLWEVRDEIYALPFLIAAFLFWLRGKHMLTFTMLLTTFLFKETMFLATATFSMMAMMWAYMNEDPGPKKRKILIGYATCFALGILCFLLYTKLLVGVLFWPTFSGKTRICSLEEFTDLEALRAKAWWATTVFLPLSPLFALAVHSILRAEATVRLKKMVELGLLLLPAAQFIGIIIISNFDMMYHPYYYYSVMPSILTCLGVYSFVGQVPTHLKIWALTLCCIIACCLGSSSDIPKNIHEGFSNEPIVSPLRALIPEDSWVITGDFETPLFIRQKRVTRIANANKSLMTFDFIVQRKTWPKTSAAYTPLSLRLRSWSEPCYEDDTWLVRCAYTKASTSKIKRQAASP